MAWHHMSTIPYNELTHWGQVMDICVCNLTTIGSDNGLSSGQNQAIIWANAGILLIGTLGTNFSEILIKLRTFFFSRKCLSKCLSGKCQQFCHGLNVLMMMQFIDAYMSHPESVLLLSFSSQFKFGENLCSL